MLAIRNHNDGYADFSNALKYNLTQVKLSGFFIYNFGLIFSFTYIHDAH